MPWTKDTQADELAKMVAQKLRVPPEVFFEVLTKPAIESTHELLAIHEEDWCEQIKAYLLRESNPEEGSKQEKHLQQRAQTYLIINEKLYKARVYGPFLRCIARTKADSYWPKFTKDYVVLTQGTDP